MRVVIFSDVHGNVVALDAVLRAIRRDAAPDALIVAGDLVVDGPRPAESLAALRAIPGARFLIGNTDQDMLQAADANSRFAFERLDAEGRDWVAALPFSQELEPAPGHGLLAVHANPKNLRDALKPDLSPELVRPLIAGVGQEVIAFGHYHVPFAREVDGKLLVDVASVGLPRDGLLRAVYVTLDFDGAAWKVAHHRVAFDAEAVARDYAAVGHPSGQKLAASMLRARY